MNLLICNHATAVFKNCHKLDVKVSSFQTLWPGRAPTVDFNMLKKNAKIHYNPRPPPPQKLHWIQYINACE